MKAGRISIGGGGGGGTRMQFVLKYSQNLLECMNFLFPFFLYFFPPSVKGSVSVSLGWRFSRC